MSLDLRKLLPQVDVMVQSIVSRNSQIDALIPDLLNAFARLHSDDQELFGPSWIKLERPGQPRCPPMQKYRAHIQLLNLAENLPF